MNSGQACRPCRGLCSPIPGRGYFGDIPGDEVVISPPSPVVEPLYSPLRCEFFYCTEMPQFVEVVGSNGLSQHTQFL